MCYGCVIDGGVVRLVIVPDGVDDGGVAAIGGGVFILLHSIVIDGVDDGGVIGGVDDNGGVGGLFYSWNIQE